MDVEKVTAFLVDYGFEREIEREKIFEIPPELVSVLPFQAIKCALFNVRIAGGEEWWDEEAGDLLFDLGPADSETDIMNMGVDDSGQEKTYLVSVQGGRFEHELVLRNLAEYVDENMAPFDGAEIEHVSAIQDTPSPQPTETEEHVDEEHKLLNILEEMEKANEEPRTDPKRPLKAESQESCTVSMATVPSLIQPNKARGMPALAVVEGVTQLERRSPPSAP